VEGRAVRVSAGTGRKERPGPGGGTSYRLAKRGVGDGSRRGGDEGEISFTGVRVRAYSRSAWAQKKRSKLALGVMLSDTLNSAFSKVSNFSCVPVAT